MIPSERAHLHIAAVTDAGLSGKDNEDRYAVSAFRLETSPPTPSLLAIVADGIGGHRAGEVASEMAVELISRFIAASDGAQPVSILQNAIIQASQEINITSESNHEQQGMGSTCACAWIINDRLYMATVGDSRIYLIRGNSIKQLSKDHTWVQEALDNGALSPEQARDHPNAHVIRRYLGSRQTVVPDLRIRLSDNETDAQAEENQGTVLLPGDCLLLCSDGLTDLVSDDEIQSQINNKKGKHALNELVALANRRGGHDNITIITVGIPEETRHPVPAPTPRRQARSNLSCIAVGVLLILIMLAIGGLAWYFNDMGVNTKPTATLSFEMMGTLPSVITSEATKPDLETPATTPSIESPALPTSTITTPTVGLPQPLVTLTPWPTNTMAATP